MQLQALHPVERVAFAPDLGRAVAAGVEEPVEDRQEHGALDRELEAAVGEQPVEDSRKARLEPEPLEDERRPGAEGLGGSEPPLADRIEHGHLVGEACTGAQQCIELARLLEDVDAAERRDHLLANLRTHTCIAHHLEVLVAA